MALVGFALVVVVTAFPWSRFGDSSRYFGAWSLHWSLVAAVAGVGGLTAAVIGRYRPVDPRLEAGAYALFAVVVVFAAVLQYRRPPLLSDSTLWPLLAAAAATLAVAGSAVKLFAIRSVQHPPH